MRHLFIINPAAGRPESTARLEALLSDPSMDTETLVDRLCRSGREGVKHVNYLMEEKGEEEEI